jgi:hypothetical protein
VIPAVSAYAVGGLASALVLALVPLPQVEGPGTFTISLRAAQIEPSVLVRGGTNAWTFPLTLPRTEEIL